MPRHAVPIPHTPLGDADVRAAELRRRGRFASSGRREPGRGGGGAVGGCLSRGGVGGRVRDGLAEEDQRSGALLDDASAEEGGVDESGRWRRVGWRDCVRKWGSRGWTRAGIDVGSGQGSEKWAGVGAAEESRDGGGLQERETA
ncbi:hypothetical protein C8R43DRAFT_1102090 [Mycena crocata]|nr:hypothetical protein C8R43DRAFT_1102090 [Mycena crocata]